MPTALAQELDKFLTTNPNQELSKLLQRDYGFKTLEQQARLSPITPDFLEAADDNPVHDLVPAFPDLDLSDDGLLTENQHTDGGFTLTQIPPTTPGYDNQFPASRQGLAVPQNNQESQFPESTRVADHQDIQDNQDNQDDASVLQDGYISQFPDLEVKLEAPQADQMRQHVGDVPFAGIQYAEVMDIEPEIKRPKSPLNMVSCCFLSRTPRPRLTL